MSAHNVVRAGLKPIRCSPPVRSSGDCGFLLLGAAALESAVFVAILTAHLEPHPEYPPVLSTAMCVPEVLITASGLGWDSCFSAMRSSPHSDDRVDHHRKRALKSAATKR